MKKNLQIIVPVAVAGILAAIFFFNSRHEAVPAVQTASLSINNEITGIEVGQTAPEIALKDLEGKEIKLSDLRGRMVLVDFWASWCRPCRMENPTVVAAYNKYKETRFKNGRGFTVYSVSLDYNKDAWAAAIKKDGLTWNNHVSDLKGWESSAAQLYDISAIPSSFLIDGDGKILEKNPRGPRLEEALFNLKK